jgi:hypothetical protein
MISNRGPSSFRHDSWAHFPPKPPVNEDLLKSAQVQVERKTFVFALKENLRGRLLRITEDSGNHRNTIIIPATGLKDFMNVLQEMLKASEELPPAQSDSDSPVNPQE